MTTAAASDIVPLVTVGEDLLAAPPEGAPEEAAWMLNVLTKLPDAWLVFAPVEKRAHEEFGFEVAALIAPTTAQFLEMDQQPEATRPPVYSLRDIAPKLIESNLGVVIVSPDEHETHKLVFTVGQLVTLIVEGHLKVSPAAGDWAKFYADRATGELSTDFFNSPDNAETLETINFAPAPDTIIPPPLRKALTVFMKKHLPELEFPVLAWNSREELAIALFAPTPEAAQKAREVIPQLGWFFPSFYPVFCLPRKV